MGQPRTLFTGPGEPLPLGATVADDGVNFSIFSQHATAVTLVLFTDEGSEPVAQLPLDANRNRTGHIWHIHVRGVDSGFLYAYRADGPFDPEGTGHRFQPEKLLLDPYGRAVAGTDTWGQAASRRLCRIARDDFDWEGDRPLKTPFKDTIIYELHVRGYTILESSGVAHPGTFSGLIEKIPHIQSLGVTAVELLPVFEFDEMEKKPVNPKTGERLKNYWGYGSVGFFAPKASYACRAEKGGALRAFKEMVKAFHRAGLEVILDVVFNHTAERDAEGPTLSFRGLDNIVYYSLDPETKKYVNISGCGNTFNCNHPVVRSLVMDCLRYWVVQMHVDGFRFDLATILGRDQKGDLLSGPSLIHDIEQDPVLADTKIIAEPWDMGAHQVGGFPGRWAEWNSFFRDDVRLFVRGDSGMVPALATRIAGSSDLYQARGRSPLNSINYITCHDGFTLNDLVSYEKKHNEENGEDNRDGTDANGSGNGGAEGASDDPAIRTPRRRRAKTFLTILMVSQGVPMVLGGDEFGRTQGGNNNAYCQDNAISWVNWDLADTNDDLLRFFRMIIALRNRHPVFRRCSFLTGNKNGDKGFPDISWHGVKWNQPDWSQSSKVIAFLLDGTDIPAGAKEHADKLGRCANRGWGEGKTEQADNDFFVMINGDVMEHTFEMPKPKDGARWLRLVDTGKPSPQDILEEGQGEPFSDESYRLAPSATAVFIAKEVG